jgi:selenocysteine-specific elongation factor
VAGASGMDGVILVVAADDGIMPQTREHLDILTLLGIRHGMIALTKIDRVDAERRLQVQADLAGFLRGTFLDGAPIRPVSNITGEGFDAFLEALQKLVVSIPPRRIDGVFRLPLDRAFTAQGFGTVAAGIPIAGSASLGDELVLLPQNVGGRVKRIEVYGQLSETVLAGQCAAINLGRCDARDLVRGNVLTLPGYFTAEEFFVCRFRLLPHEKINLKNGVEIKFHTGTTEVNAVLYLLEGEELKGGAEHLVQLRVKRPVVAGPGDPFILRTFAPVQTVGGGTIVEAVPRRLKRNRAGVIEELRRRADAVAEDAAFVEYAVRTAAELAVGESELGRRVKILPKRLQEIVGRLIREQKLLTVGSGLYIHRATAEESGVRLLAKLEEYHRRSPESPGMSADQLRQACPWPKAVLEGITALQKSAGRIVERNQRLALAGHQATYRDQDTPYLEAIEALFRKHLFSPPSTAELIEKTGAPAAAVERLLRSLQEHQKLVAVGEGIIFHREAVDRARELLVEYIRKEGRLESVHFKYLIDTTRKFALPLLDYFDRNLLRRVGNTRYLRAQPGV